MDEWFATLRSGRCLSEADFRSLCTIVSDIMMEEPSVRQVPLPVAICGDIHGQFFDLLNVRCGPWRWSLARAPAAGRDGLPLYSA